VLNLYLPIAPTGFVVGKSLMLCHCKTVKIKSWPWMKMPNGFVLETATEIVQWRTYFVPGIGEHWARINYM